MNQQELNLAISKRMIANIADGGGPLFVEPLSQPGRVGVRAATSPMLGNPEPSSDGAWIVVIGDRDGNRGPASFEDDNLEALLRNATGVVMDTAKRWRQAYEPFTDAVNRGARIVVIQSVRSRRMVWHAFVRENSDHGEVFELLPCGPGSICPAKLVLTEIDRTG